MINRSVITRLALTDEDLALVSSTYLQIPQVKGTNLAITKAGSDVTFTITGEDEDSVDYGIFAIGKMSGAILVLKDAVGNVLLKV